MLRSFAILGFLPLASLAIASPVYQCPIENANINGTQFSLGKGVYMNLSPSCNSPVFTPTGAKAVYWVQVTAAGTPPAPDVGTFVANANPVRFSYPVLGPFLAGTFYFDDDTLWTGNRSAQQLLRFDFTGDWQIASTTAYLGINKSPVFDVSLSSITGFALSLPKAGSSVAYSALTFVESTLLDPLAIVSIVNGGFTAPQYGSFAPDAPTEYNLSAGRNLIGLGTFTTSISCDSGISSVSATGQGCPSGYLGTQNFTLTVTNPSNFSDAFSLSGSFDVFVVVPEPSTTTLVLLGCAAIGVARRAISRFASL